MALLLRLHHSYAHFPCLESYVYCIGHFVVSDLSFLPAGGATAEAASLLRSLSSTRILCVLSQLLRFVSDFSLPVDSATARGCITLTLTFLL